MYLNLLNEEQKKSFLALATKVVMADGGVVPEENVTLDVRVAEMGGKIVAPAEEVYGDPNTANFKDPRSRAILLLELLVLAYSDSEYHASERPIIDQLVKDFGVSDDQFAKFERWAQRQAPLSVEGWEIIRELEGDWAMKAMGIDFDAD